MKKKQQINLSTIISALQKQLVGNRPTIAKMYEEIRMMKFVIRPLQGDITTLNFNDTKLIETLWSLGKLDEFFQKKFKEVPKNQRGSFMQVFDQIHKNFQDQLNTINLKPEKTTTFPVLEMEIFKEKSPRKKSN